MSPQPTKYLGLAACFMDSLATHNYPAIGYGIRYVYGTFSQRIENGEQREYPDNWLERGNPWELPRFDRSYEIQFGGKVESFRDFTGRWHFSWVGGDSVSLLLLFVNNKLFNVFSIPKEKGKKEGKRINLISCFSFPLWSSQFTRLWPRLMMS